MCSGGFMADVQAAIAGERKALDELSSKLDSHKLPDCKRVGVPSLLDDKWLGEMKHAGIERGVDYVYVFTLADDCDVTLDALLKGLASYKEKKSENVATCRINKVCNDSNVLYVGRTKSPMTRFKQHMGLGGKATYAMHLARWYVGDSPLSLVIKYFPAMGYKEDEVHRIESALWKHYRPIFGKSGGR